MILYIYRKCSTCQNALRFLEKTLPNHPVAVKEINLTPPTIEELKSMLNYQNGNLRKLFNTSGIQYKELKLKDKLNDLSLDEALKMLSQNGMLVKRPFLLGKNFGLVGFNDAEWTKNLTAITKK